MVISTTLKRDTAPYIRDSRGFNLSLDSIIVECSLAGRRVINTQGRTKTKYVPIEENTIARVYSKISSKDLGTGAFKCARKVELIRFTINKKTKEVTDIEQDKNDYILLKAKNSQASAEEQISKEIDFLNKYANQPGILPIIAQYSYISSSRTWRINGALKKAIITRRLQDLFSLLANPKNQAKLSISKQELDLFKKEAKIQLLKAVLAIHEKGDIHRDLKLENILWEKVDDSLKFYLIDFGLSLDDKESRNVKKLAGTYRYCDPQILDAMLEERESRNEAERQEIRNEATNQTNDIFSLGLTFYFLRESTHRLPNSIQMLMDEQGKFPDNEIDLDNISSLPFFRSPNHDQYSFRRGSFEHLVWRMLRPNPEERITAQEAFEWLARINNETK